MSLQWLWKQDAIEGGAGRTRMKVLKFTSKDFIAFGVFALLFVSTLIVRFAI